MFTIFAGRVGAESAFVITAKQLKWFQKKEEETRTRCARPQRDLAGRGQALNSVSRKCNIDTVWKKKKKREKHKASASSRPPGGSSPSVPAGVTCGQLLIFSSFRVSLLLATSTFRDGSSTGVSSISSEDSDLELTNTTVRAEMK